MIDAVEKKQLMRHKDERGFFEEVIRVTDDFFREGFGQLSRSSMRRGVVKAWHVHQTQVDWWYVVRGTIKLVMYDLRQNSPTRGELNEFLLGEEGENVVIKIPARVAHGLKVLEGPAELVYVTSATYNQKEEGRIPYDDPEIGYDWVQGIPITNKNIT